MSIAMYDPESSNNPKPRMLEVQKPDGEVVSIDRFHHEQKVAKATLTRTIVVNDSEWGPGKHRTLDDSVHTEYEDN